MVLTISTNRYLYFINLKRMFGNKRENTLWVEKYRPQKLSEYIGNDLLKEKVQGYLDTGDVPHLLLYGKAGTGKTTLAKIIANTIECLSLIHI